MSDSIQTKITIRDNGPLLVEGPFRLQDAEGNVWTLDANKSAFAFCRCGQTGNAPFCDGSHKSCGFSSVIRTEKA